MGPTRTERGTENSSLTHPKSANPKRIRKLLLCLCMLYTFSKLVCTSVPTMIPKSESSGIVAITPNHPQNHLKPVATYDQGLGCPHQRSNSSVTSSATCWQMTLTRQGHGPVMVERNNTQGQRILIILQFCCLKQNASCHVTII